jgi:hypothetical protein
VDTIVRPPETRVTSTPPRPRWARRLAVALGLLLLASSILYVWRYQPLTANGSGGWWVDPRFGTHIGDFTSPAGNNFSAYRVRYVDGETFRYGLTLNNEGPLPVTITSIGDDGCDGCVFPLEFERSTVAPGDGPFRFDQHHTQPFETVELSPGDYRFFVIESRFDHCEASSPGMSYGYGLVQVTYRIGFAPHSVRLPMPYSLEVEMERAGCPNGMGSST